MDDIKLSKTKIRKDIIAKRNLLSTDELDKAGNELCRVLKNDSLYRESHIILAYASYGTEIPTYSFIKCTIEDSKSVFLPKVVDNKMIFFRIESVDELIIGYKGIPEPKGDSEIYSSNDKAMMLMPGVAFDKEGNRLGYGGGFYDRFLEDNPELLDRSIAFGMHFQMIENIPTEAFDIKPSKIVII